MKLSVIIPSHNSRADFLARVLNGLRAQRLAYSAWELLVIDNASREPLISRLDLSGFPNARLLRVEVPEAEASLVGARCRGINGSTGDVLVFVDDDNVLAPDYLQHCAAIAVAWPRLGAWGGNIVLEYEDPANRLPAALEPLLCCRKVTEPLWSNVKDHHASTPWGAGLCVRREVALAYLRRLECEPDRRGLDPVGRQMRFGGDTDLVYTGLLLGYGKGVFPELLLTHLIPSKRCDLAYQERALEAHGYSSVLHQWLDTGQAPQPRTGVRFWLGESVRWLKSSRWERMQRRARRRGEWRAFRELHASRPRILGTFDPKPL